MTDQIVDEAKIAAPEQQAGEERRKRRRKKCLLPACLLTSGGSYDCDVLDLSNAGAKVETSAVVTPEQPVTLVVKPIGTFTGVVAWCGDDGCFGMRFLAQRDSGIVKSTSLQAALAALEKPVPRSEPDARTQSPQVDTAPLLAPSAERSFVLRYDDIICLLRRKSNQRAADATEKAVVTDLADCKFIEMDSRDFTALSDQESAFAVAFLRVAPLT